jgi:hypothetical protein
MWEGQECKISEIHQMSLVTQRPSFTKSDGFRVQGSHHSRFILEAVELHRWKSEITNIK